MKNELERITTCELTELLSTRDGVELIRVDPYQLHTLTVEGPCEILVVTD